MKQATLFNNTTITAICERIPACSRLRIFVLDRMEKSSLAVRWFARLPTEGLEFLMTVRTPE